MEIDAKRVFQVLDDLREKISVLCDRQTRMEMKYEEHIRDLEEKQERTEEKNRQDNEKRTRKFYGILALITILVTVAEFVILEVVLP